ncbi:MAG: pyruvate dehydrogenase complex dihydrolipoamide acetyltransferase [Alphaproteobacteria bacterium]|nr:pyruvate dehydrogenase complex dihydrolipoamide acetyltransferase [Alphaproteobacteria bacterium]
MPIQILMPALSPTMTEGNLVKWHKKEGDVIKAGQVLAEIETDKATMEVEAVDEGILAKILVAEGTDDVKVNQLIALILEEGEDASSLDNLKTPVLAAAPVTKPVTETIAPEIEKAAASVHEHEGGRVFITPLAKRIAEQNHVDSRTIMGSGPNGRIVKADVEKALNGGLDRAAVPALSLGGYTDIKLNGMRKVIAKRLTESKQTVPHFYLSVDCELDTLMDFRRQLNNRPSASYKLSVNDFVIRACALALKEVPEANVTWHETYVRQYNNADISVAVAVDGGLVTPVIRACEQKSVAELSSEMKSLATRARAGKLMPEEYQGGNFSLSNLGMYGVKSFAAIINPPQACILAVGVGEERAIVKNGQIVVATVMNCTLSVDHRAVDGAIGARFLAAFKSLIENPLGLFV